MASKITRKGCLTKPSEILLLVTFFIFSNILILSHFQDRTLKNIGNPWRSNSSDCLQSYYQTIEDSQILTFEEDGRFGNLLLETATLLLIGKKLNTPVKILPQVGKKLEKFLSALPAPTIDFRKTCVCTYCSDCICPVCNKWTKMPAYNFLANPSNNSHVMLKWFHSDLVLQNIEFMRDIWRPLLRTDVVETVQGYLRGLQGKAGRETTFVRRTDYINWIEKRYKGQQVGRDFFLHSIEEFLAEDPGCLFLVISDDLEWCKENIVHERVVFPSLSIPSVDPAVTDFILMTQSNHTIYDYGSFAFWGAVLAGGKTIVADGYSERIHPILAAIKKFPPNHWKTKNIKSLN